MNKIFPLSLLLGASVAFAGCAGEEDNIFSQSAAERLNAASALYSSRLEAQPNGWVMQLYPTTDNEAPFGNGYLVLVDFNKDKSVKAAMNNVLSGNAFMEDSSSWEVITDNGPVLTFNTYNKVIHTFSNPEDVPSTGTQESPKNETGAGIGGDYEFVIVDAPADASYMLLKGKKRGTYNLLTPMEQGVTYNDYIVEMTAFQRQMFPARIPTFDVIHFGDSIYKMEGADDGIPNIYPYNSDAVLNESFNPFLVTKNGNDYFLRFRDPRTYGTTVVQEFRYNQEKDQFQMVTKNGRDYTVNENYYISGDDPLRFFNQTATDLERLRNWRMGNNGEKSESFKTVYDNIVAAFRSRNITLNAIQFRKKTGEDRYQVGFSYRNRTQTVVVWYDYSYAKDDAGITLTYSAPSDASGQTLLTRVPELQTILDVFSQKFTVTRDKTAFDLNSIKLVSAADANQWFVLSLM